MKKQVHIISHTHWDREWYINSRYVNEWLPPFFDGLFAMMEKEPGYRFMLDGQTSMLDDCYVELEKLGRNVDDFRERVKHYAERGQLVLGPYYLQPDWQLASGEALIRNMMIGRRMSQELCGGMNTGWLLDNFGQISQAPQLHRLFGMKGIVLWRGVELDPFSLTSEFEWVGADGTRMTSSYLLSSYRNAMHLADYPAIARERIRSETEKIAPFSVTGNVLLMNGYDQEMQPDDILPIIREGGADFDGFSIFQSTPDQFMDALLENRKELPQLHGPLYSGRYISVFPGILSARMYLKQMNDAAQRQLEQYAEPLCALCAAMGRPYPHKDLEAAWKLLLKNHAHDSICGVGVDDVHHDMVDRFGESLKLSRSCTEQAASWLSSVQDTRALEGALGVFTLFNTLPAGRTATVFLPCESPAEVCVKDAAGRVCPAQPCAGGVAARVELPPLGIASVGLFGGLPQGQEPAGDGLEAENEFLHVRCNQDGTFDVTDKKTGRKYAGVGALEDSADSGDEYNYSFVKGDVPRTTAGIPAQVQVTERGPVRTVFRVSRVWRLPEALSAGRGGRSEALREIPVETQVTLTQGDPVLRFRTALRNTCRDHRIRVLFPTYMDAEYSYAQTQFDVTRHPIFPPAMDNDNIPETVKRIIIGARESLPITQFPQRDFCAVTDGETTAAVLNMGLPEYEVLPENRTVALTLFRSVGWLARFDLNTRIGDAGPEMLTPGAQCLRDMEFTYGFCSMASAPDGRELDLAAQAFCTPVLAVQTDVHGGGKLPSAAALAGDRAVRLTAFKCREGGQDLIMRLYNVADEVSHVRVELPMSEKAWTAAAYEEAADGLPLENGCAEICLKPREIVTIGAAWKQHAAPAGSTEALHTWREEPMTCDFSGWQIPDCVTEQEVRGEEARAEAAEADYRRQQALADQADLVLKDNGSTPHQRTEAASAIMLAHAKHRAALEARLSAVFAREELERLRLGEKSQAFIEYQNSLTPQLREIAYGLNLARIDKRVSEYITDYYEHLEKLSSR